MNQIKSPLSRLRKRCFVGLLFLVLSIPFASSAAGTERLVVYPLQTEEGFGEVSNTLADIVANQIAQVVDYEVLTYDDLRNVVEYEALKQALGQDQSDEVLVAVSEKANAAYIVKGSLAKLGSAKSLSLTLIQTVDASVLRRINQTLYGDVAQVSASLRTASQALLSELSETQAESISAQAFKQVYWGEKPKTWDIRISAGPHTPMGLTQSERGAPLIRANQWKLQANVGRFVSQSVEMGLFFSVAHGSAEPVLQARLGIRDETTDPTNDDPVEKKSINVLTSIPSFSVTTFQFGPQVLLRPSTGTFLPFVAAGVGIALDKREVKNVVVVDFLPALGGGNCDLQAYTVHNPEESTCEITATLEPTQSAKWRLGGALQISVGAELVLADQVAIRVAIGYGLQAYGSKSETVLVQAKQSYTGSELDIDPGYNPGEVTFSDFYARPRMEQSFSSELGMLFYW